MSIAEELAPDALLTALELWRAEGIPENPNAWLMTAAKRRALSIRCAVAPCSWRLGDALEHSADQMIDDDILRLIFTALQLRRICGLTGGDRPRLSCTSQDDRTADLSRPEDPLGSRRPLWDAVRRRAAPRGNLCFWPRHGRMRRFSPTNLKFPVLFG